MCLQFHFLKNVKILHEFIAKNILRIFYYYVMVCIFDALFDTVKYLFIH